jgi:hypothetical protein
MRLTDPPDSPGAADVTTPRERLGQELVSRCLHQLHRAADDLRVTAMRFRARADELDAVIGSAS